ncbi:MAG: hypothetical protein OEX97_03660 [Acidimicrobiia bacterium]|nr:hypothetical protein [Acidimicrobiia bacterium]
MGEVKYTAEVRIERVRGPIRKVWLPPGGAPHMFGVHSEIAEHYGVSMDDYPSTTATIDWVIAAAAG